MARIRVAKMRFWFIVILPLVIIACLLQRQYVSLAAQQQRTIEELEQRKQQLLIQIEDIQRKLTFSQSDNYVERIARSELGLVMPGEVLYVESLPE